MKKYIGIFVALALFTGFAGAQITGGGVNVQCVRYNPDGTCAQTSVTGNVTTGSGQTNPCAAYPGTVPVNQNGQIRCVQQGTTGAQTGTVYTTGGPAYQTGANTRQLGAQQADLSFIGGLINQTGGLVRLLPPILIGIAVVVFFIFLIKYFLASSAEVRKKNLNYMLYALGAIFIMVALWGIIAFFGDIIGINPNVQVTAPTLPR